MRNTKIDIVQLPQKSRDKKKDQLQRLCQQRREIVQRQQREATRKRVAKCRALKKEKENSVADSTPPFSSAIALPGQQLKLKEHFPKLYRSFQEEKLFNESCTKVK